MGYDNDSSGYGLWIPEGYGILLVTELVDTQSPWVITGYGLSQVWFRTESTDLPSVDPG
jgi:hypothetical protein